MEPPTSPQHPMRRREDAPLSSSPPSPVTQPRFTKGEIDLAFDEPSKMSPTRKPIDTDQLAGMKMPETMKVRLRCLASIILFNISP